MTQLGQTQRLLLREALRRYTRFHQREGKALTEAWTGLGSASEYAPVARAGYMEIATSPNPGFTTWWRLTPRGAAIVQAWLEDGVTFETIEAESNKARSR